MACGVGVSIFYALTTHSKFQSVQSSIQPLLVRDSVLRHLPQHLCGECFRFDEVPGFLTRPRFSLHVPEQRNFFILNSTWTWTND
jgi:hypothetical protein